MAVSYTGEKAEEANTAWADPETIGAAFTPANNSLLTCCLGLVDSATAFDTTLTGGGYTWSNVRAGSELTDTQFFWLEAVYALVSTGVSTTLSADQTEAVTGGVGWCGEWAGHDTTTPVKANSNYATYAAAKPAVSLTGAPDADSVVVVSDQTQRNPPAWTAEAGWTQECNNGHATPANGLSVWRSDPSADQSFTATAGTNGIGHSNIFEIDAAAAGGVTIRTLAALGVGLYPILTASWTGPFVKGVFFPRARWEHPLRHEIHDAWAPELALGVG
jgi:hypothetical protein